MTTPNDERNPQDERLISDDEARNLKIILSADVSDDDALLRAAELCEQEDI